MATKRHRPINFEDVTLDCLDCGEPFVFGAGERITFADRGWSEPRYCPLHRGKKHRHKHRQLPKQMPKQEQPYRPTNLDDVLARARQVIARYRESN